MAAPLEITLFGPMQVQLEDQPLPRLRSRKALWLLALLALRNGAPTTRERLAFALWPDTPTSTALANLRVVVSDLRQALQDQKERILTPNRSTVGLDMAGTTVDALEFNRAFLARDFESAARLYSGELLEGCPEEWAGQERRVRKEQALEALQTLGHQAERSGDCALAIDWFQKALTVDPHRDEPLRGLMGALAARGDINGALQAYREFSHRLRQNLGGAPDKQTAELYARLRQRNRQSARPGNVEEEPDFASAVGNLPRSVSPLIGREDERLEVASRLRLNRLVALTGVGGVGKTRLGIEVATEARAAFADGVWFVPLEALSEGAQVVQAIAAALDFREEAGVFTLDTLVKKLRLQRSLLVLDNCEHLLAACAEVCETLLRSCGELRLLVTSREALGIPGENVYQVPGLSVPAVEHLPHNGATRTRVALGYESIALFVERAQSVAPHFVLNGDNAAQVAEICVYLEGIPLAIELAAVQASSMSVASIASRLEDLLAPFAVGHRALHPRQQTMRATLDWSYDLLPTDERRALERLSVFAGGWTFEAAEAVLEDEAPKVARVSWLLHALVSKSLAVFDSGLDRYRLLEPIREYAAQKLALSGEKSATGLRHRAYFLRFAQEAETGLEGAEQIRWLGKIALEDENLLAASESAETGLAIAAAIHRFWYIRGEFEKGFNRLQSALAQCPTPNEARRKALYSASVMLYCRKQFEETRVLSREAIAIAERLGNPLGAALGWNLLASICHQLNDHDRERIYREQSLQIFREVQYQRGIIASVSSSAHCLLGQGRYALARPVFQDVLRIVEERGDLTNICITQLHLGSVEYFMGHYEAAQGYFEACHQTQERLASRRGIAMSLHGQGNIKHAQGDFQTARKIYSQALELFREVGERPMESAILWALAAIESQELRFPQAHELIEASLAINRELGDKRGLTEALRVRATIFRRSNDIPAAQAAIRQCLHLAQEVEQPHIAAEAFEEAGAICLRQNEPVRAARFWGVAASLREWMGSPVPPNQVGNLERWRGEAEEVLGAAEFEAATLAGAGMDWREAAREL